MRIQRLARTAVLFLAGSFLVSADSFSLQFASSAGSANLALTADGTGDSGEYLVSAATGTINGLSVVSLVAINGYPDPGADTSNDNLLFYPLSSSHSTYVDDGGISFLLFGGRYVNLYFDDGSYFYIDGVTPMDENPRTAINSIAVTQTPEPSSLALLTIGVLGALSMITKKRL